DVPGPVRERQTRIASRMQGLRMGAGVWTPSWLSAVRSATADQLDEFKRLYGSPPSHVDGHEHVHQSLPVLMAGCLPSGTKIRPALTFMPGEKRAANRAARSMANRLERVRFRMPRYFFSLRDMHPDLGGRDLDEKLALSSGAAVEVMTHPSWDDEQAVLLDADWRGRIALRPLGSYRDL
ncbi:MAG: ChbG/HpnK family deacetylase, partial [Solirubrobacteraceae bacterium]